MILYPFDLWTKVNFLSFFLGGEFRFSPFHSLNATGAAQWLHMVREVRGMLRGALTAVGGHQAEDAGLLNLLNPTATGVQEVIASGKRWCPAI